MHFRARNFSETRQASASYLSSPTGSHQAEVQAKRIPELGVRCLVKLVGRVGRTRYDRTARSHPTIATSNGFGHAKSPEKYINGRRVRTGVRAAGGGSPRTPYGGILDCIFSDH